MLNLILSLLLDPGFAKRDAHEARTAAINARPKPRVNISITPDGVEEFKKAKARIEAREKFRACYGR